MPVRRGRRSPAPARRRRRRPRLADSCPSHPLCSSRRRRWRTAACRTTRNRPAYSPSTKYPSAKARPHPPPPESPAPAQHRPNRPPGHRRHRWRRTHSRSSCPRPRSPPPHRSASPPPAPRTDHFPRTTLHASLPRCLAAPAGTAPCQTSQAKPLKLKITSAFTSNASSTTAPARVLIDGSPALGRIST
ncbi:hypothetical protein D3C78_1240690 [compost metagenome]